MTTRTTTRHRHRRIYTNFPRRSRRTRRFLGRSAPRTRPPISTLCVPVKSRSRSRRLGRALRPSRWRFRVKSQTARCSRRTPFWRGWISTTPLRGSSGATRFVRTTRTRAWSDLKTKSWTCTPSPSSGGGSRPTTERRRSSRASSPRLTTSRPRSASPTRLEKAKRHPRRASRTRSVPFRERRTTTSEGALFS